MKQVFIALAMVLAFQGVHAQHAQLDSATLAEGAELQRLAIESSDKVGKNMGLAAVGGMTTLVGMALMVGDALEMESGGTSVVIFLGGGIITIGSFVKMLSNYDKSVAAVKRRNQFLEEHGLTLKELKQLIADSEATAAPSS